MITIFAGKAWTPVQAHNAVAAHLNSHTQAIPIVVSTANDTTNRSPDTDGIMNTASGMHLLSNTGTNGEQHLHSHAGPNPR
jgi:hypothetical protein